MRIPFEEWVRQQKPSAEALACYEESLLCYRIGANRAALLFSYLGFMTYLRERILASQTPAGVPGGLWLNIQARVRADDAWDATVFDTTQQRAPAPIFLVTDELRQQVLYWKNRRNDCAHSKDNIIEVSHVEGLWAFTKSNLNKFVVNGSRAAMRQKIARHFDTALTPPGQPCDLLVAEIAQTVAVAELPDFLGELAQDFEATRTPDEVAANTENRNWVLFLDRCLSVGDVHLVAAVQGKIIGDRQLLVRLLRAFPNRTGILADHPDQVRRCWNEDLFSNQKDDLPVLASLFRNGLIPEGERVECLETLLRRGMPSAPTALDDVDLADAGFYAVLERIAVDEGQLSQFQWANTSAAILVHHIQRSPITVEMARRIYRTFDTGYNPRDLRPRLNTVFEGNPAKREEFLAIEAAHADIGRPQYLPALH